MKMLLFSFISFFFPSFFFHFFLFFLYKFYIFYTQFQKNQKGKKKRKKRRRRRKKKKNNKTQRVTLQSQVEKEIFCTYQKHLYISNRNLHYKLFSLSFFLSLFALKIHRKHFKFLTNKMKGIFPPCPCTYFSSDQI